MARATRTDARAGVPDVGLPAEPVGDRTTARGAGRQAQLARFAALAPQLADRYAEACAGHSPDLVAAEWHARNAPLERWLLPVPDPGFVAHPSVRYSMFVDDRYAGHELPPLRAGYDAATLRRALAEDPAGNPPLLPTDGTGVETSANAVHHLHHLWRLRAVAGVDVRDLDVVLEWGGGYGSMARVARRLHGRGLTYVSVDTPLFAALQWLYLSAVLGPQAVHWCTRPADVRPGAVTVVPVRLAADLEVRPDLFLSTWALNESPAALQDMVVRRSWYGAPHLLLGLHATAPLAARAVADGARQVAVGPWSPAQTYCVR